MEDREHLDSRADQEGPVDPLGEVPSRVEMAVPVETEATVAVAVAAQGVVAMGYMD
jgi:hypothetical protein